VGGRSALTQSEWPGRLMARLYLANVGKRSYKFLETHCSEGNANHKSAWCILSGELIGKSKTSTKLNTFIVKRKGDSFWMKNSREDMTNGFTEINCQLS